MLASGVWLLLLIRLLPRHSHVSDWILGKSPRKTKMQELGELLAKHFLNKPGPPHLDDLKIIVRRAGEDPLDVDVELHNSSPFRMSQISINRLCAGAFLMPGVSDWDQWNHGPASARKQFDELLLSIEIPELAVGDSAVVRRRLFPSVLPISTLVNVKLLHEVAPDSVAKYYYVKAALDASFG